MRQLTPDPSHPSALGGAEVALGVGPSVVRSVADALAGYALDPSSGAGASGAELIDLVAALERLRAAASAALARTGVAFDVQHRTEQREAGMPARRLGLGVADQLALARRVSPAQGARDLGRAKTLCSDLRHTLAALAHGQLNELQAHRIVEITSVLEVEDRVLADLELAGGGAAAERLASLSTRAVEAETRRLAYRLDPETFVKARVKAESERRVTVRPAPDGMEYVSGLVGMRAGIACYKALKQDAEAKRAAGDPRSLNQIQADTFVERLTGQSVATTPVEVTLILTPETLLGDDEPAETEHGPIPAEEARSWLLDWLAGIDDDAAVAFRRAMVHPVTRDLTHLDTRSRDFTPTMRRAIGLRDRYCSTPGCGAPLRHIDHTIPVADGGETTVGNGRGTCERCNYAKEAPGWRVRVLDDASPGGGRVVEITTPTGHTYRSQPPPLPGVHPRR